MRQILAQGAVATDSMPLLAPTPSTLSQVTLAIYIEARERFERHINPTYNGPKDSNRSDLYNRYRLGLKLNAGKSWAGVVEYQNATDVFWSHPGNGITHNSDASLAYLKYDSKKLDLSLGREKIALGDMRLIGPTEWTNLSRSFDVGRAQSGQWDLWGGTLGMANKDTKTVRLADLTRYDQTWGTASLILKHDEGSIKTIDEQTLDYFVKRKFGLTTLDGEAALQIGSNNGKDQRAWAYHVRAAQEVVKETLLSIEADAASGGSTHDTSRTFDNLYPSNHGLYGLADTTGWKNMNYLALRLENRSIDRLTLRATEQTISLRDPRDAWYGFSGSANARSGGTFQDSIGKSGLQLGHELDFEAIYSLKRYGTVSAGIALFNPGDFVRNLSGHADQATFGYLQYEIRL